MLKDGLYEQVINNKLDTDVKLDTAKSLVNEPFNGVEEEITLGNNEL